MDFENIVLGLPQKAKFKPKAVLNRVLEEGKIVYKRAYADWSRYDKYKVQLHELGFDLLEIPRRAMTGKNSADIRMVVDAMGLVISKEHIDTFCLVTGDSDFTPLVSSLREHDKHVVGIGVKDSSSRLLIDSCDAFVFYEEIEGVAHDTTEKAREKLTSAKVEGRALNRRRAEGLILLIKATRALMRSHDTVWASMVKQTMVRQHPSFSESYHGYTTFSKLIEDAVNLEFIKATRDEKSGNYRITGVGDRVDELGLSI